jgi:phage-related protein (TIGR01555 family)
MEIQQIKNQIDSRGAQALNSLSGLVESAGVQSNLTSLNPMIQNTLFAPLTLQWSLLTYLYKTHGIIQTAIDMPVLDALRGGVDIHSGELSHDDTKALLELEEEVGAFSALSEAMVWVRLFGGGGLIVNTNQTPEQPLSLTGLKKIEFYPFSRWELQAPGINPKSPWEMMGFGAPIDSEFFTFYGKRIHRSRVLTISGKAAPYVIRWQLQGWGMSEVEKMLEDFNKYLRTSNVLYELLEEAKIDVYKLDGFNAQLMSAAGTAKTQQRMALVNQLKNFNKAITMDMKDDYEQKQLAFGGLSDVMKENRIGIASALRIPMTKLFGLSAAGFNSGEDDIENYNAMVESEVRQKLRRPLKQILKFLCAVKFGEPFDVSFEFKPLRMMSSVEEENIKASKQNRAVQLYQAGLLTVEEVAGALEHEKLIEADTDASKGLVDDTRGQETGGGPGEGDEGEEE